MNRVLFIGHSYHQKTKSSAFLIELLRNYYEVSALYIDPSALQTIPRRLLSNTTFDILVLWQIMPSLVELRKYLTWQHTVFFPMYDHFEAMGGMENVIWKEYEDVRIICFSKCLHQQLLTAGYDSNYIQYFPKPRTFDNWGDSQSIFFWQRISKLNLSTLATIAKNIDVHHVHWHKAIDPNHIAMPPSSYASYFQTFYKNVNLTESVWFSSKDELYKEIEKHAFYLAPRYHEGIGMGFLDAMAMGRCVIANHSSTMNEYIQDGVTGLLFHWTDITNSTEHVEVTLPQISIREIQENAFHFIETGYEKWQKEKTQVLDWCSKGGSKMNRQISDKQYVGVQDDKKQKKLNLLYRSYLPEILFIGHSLFLCHFRQLYYFLLVLCNSRFNRRWYLSQYAEVKYKRMSPAAHYLNIGWLRNYDPSPLFSTHSYLLKNPDVGPTGLCPLVHWKLRGKKEHRSL